MNQPIGEPAQTASMRSLMTDLFPLCRSITGEGVRQTLRRIQAEIPVSVYEVSTGTPVLDWTVPEEWNVRSAWIKDPSGNTIVDLTDSSLHLMSYSEPIRARMSLPELKEHLHSLPDRPTSIPYVTSYYRRNWGFCLRHDLLETLVDEGRYEVFIDSDFTQGSLTYGELVVPGSTGDEILITTHICHPSMANDNLSGIAVVCELAKLVAASPRRLTFRFLFIPGTIGSITWLATHRAEVEHITGGMVVTGVGDLGDPCWKRPRANHTAIDRVARNILASRGEHRIMEFYPYGYDERQFCSPGFDLAVGRFGRQVHGEYPEYHTSADDLSFVHDASMAESLRILSSIVHGIDANLTYVNLEPYGEPQLGRRDLYRNVGGAVDRRSAEMAVLWMLSLSDGTNDVEAISTRSGIDMVTLAAAADRLNAAGLLGLSPDPGAALR